jgi:hypothetical protein
MSSKPQKVKEKPINHALIAQTRADGAAQIKRINEGLQTYKQQAIANIDNSLMQQRSVMANSITDATVSTANTQALRNTTNLLLQRRVSSQQAVNQGNVQLAGNTNVQAQRGAANANNKQQGQRLMRRSGASG